MCVYVCVCEVVYIEIVIGIIYNMLKVIKLERNVVRCLKYLENYRWSLEFCFF